jgi:hypothetical protein
MNIFFIEKIRVNLIIIDWKKFFDSLAAKYLFLKSIF